MLSPQILTSTPVRFAIALFLVALALVTRVLLSPLLGDYLPYATVLVAVALAARYLGAGPAILAVAAAVIGERYWLIPPTHHFSIPGPGHVVGALGFLFTAAIIIAFGETNRRSVEEARRNREGLEIQVRQRTTELDAANKNLRELTGHILHLQDQERRRIARELHDSAGQSLAVLAMKLSAIKTEVEAQIKALLNTAESAGETIALVSDTSTEIRTISYLLHPPLLDEVGLTSAVKWYVEGVARRSGFKVEMDFADDLGRLNRPLEIALFRVIQEGLTNIHRHAQTDRAMIKMMRNRDRVSLEIRDFGKGMSPRDLERIRENTGPTGVGLAGMRERIAQLGGSFEIHSDGQGTLVTVVVPAPYSEPAMAAD